MPTAVRGFLLGFAAGLLLAALIGGGTRFDAFVRVSGGGQLLLDARLDETAIGRVTNFPAGSLGDAAVAKRTWILVTTYRFVLHLRPEVAPGPGRAVQELQVSIALPGRVTATNATRIVAGAAIWDTVSAGELRVHTRAIHWGRIFLLLAIIVAASAIARMVPGLFGMSQRS